MYSVNGASIADRPSLRRRPGYPCEMSNITRRERESRAFALTLAAGGFSIAAVVLFVTALVGATGFGLFLLALLAAAGSVAALRKTLHK